MRNTIKGILFDKDGTLFDFNTTWGNWAHKFFLDLAKGDTGRAAEYSARFGYDRDSGTFDLSSPIIAEPVDEIARVLIAAVPDWPERELIDFMNESATNTPQAEAVPLIPYLTDLRTQGLKLGVATNDAEVPARAHLASAGITHLFDFIAGYDSGFGGKPEPGMQHGFCNQTGLDPFEVAMVGDSRHDLKAGRAAGMTTVAVLTGPASKDDLVDFADVVLADIGHLPAYLASETP